MITNEQRDILAQEICFFMADGPKCTGNCRNCEYNYWHKFRLSAKKVIKKYKELTK